MLAPSLSLVAELCCRPLQAVSGPVLPTKDDLNIRLFLPTPLLHLPLARRPLPISEISPSASPTSHQCALATSLKISRTPQPIKFPSCREQTRKWLQLLLLKSREEDKVEVRRCTDVAVEFVLSELDAELKRSCRIKLGTSLAFGFHG